MKNLLFKRLLGVSLLLIVCTNSIWANTDDVIKFNELKLGDWFELNQTTPSNDFSITWKGIVKNRTEQEVIIEFSLSDLFILVRSTNNTNGTKVIRNYYTDSNFPYTEKGGVQSDLISNPPKITMIRSINSIGTPNIEIHLSDSSRNYQWTGYTRGLDNSKKKYLEFWMNSKLNIDEYAEQIKPFVMQHELISLPDLDLREASFKLRPNTYIEYKLNGYVEAGVPQIYRNDNEEDITYLDRGEKDNFSLSLHLNRPTKMTFKGHELWLSPGDSLVITPKVNDGLSITGKGAEICEIATDIYKHTRNIHNNLVYAYYDVDNIANEIEKIEKIYTEKLYPNKSKIDPYWYQSAKLSLSYIKSTVLFGNFSKPNLVEEWSADSFDSICPMLDYKYQPEFYHNFARAFYRNQCALLNNNNITNKGYWAADRSTFYLIKQLFSGYMQSYLWIEAIENMLEVEPISKLREEIAIIKSHCYDTELNDKLRKLEIHYTKLENGNNIKELNADFINLLSLKDRADGYILLNITIFDQDSSIMSNIDSIIIENNIKKEVKWINIRGEHYKDNLTEEHIKEKENSGYIYLNMDNMEAYYELGLANDILLILRNDGTIIGRTNINSEAPEAVKNIILKDKEEAATAPLLSRTQLYLILGAFTVLVTIFGIYYNSRIRKQKLQTKLSQLKLKAIRSQMNPHFIFNALTSIQSLILRSDIEQSNHYLTTFSRMLRNVLTSSEKTLIPLASELELIEQYLQIEQLRMPISYNLVVADDICTDSIEIPGMLLQPIVENAVIHGLFPQQGGQIDIKLWLEENSLWCNIIDNGVGLNKSSDSKSTFGLNSIQERLTLLNDSKATQVKLNITNRLDKEGVSGCRVVITIPL